LPEDAQLAANGIVAPPADPAVGAPLIINHPVNVTGVPRVGATPAPDLGQHTDEVLSELGFSAAEAADLHRRGIV
jgi:crotonobetainyl-CoA:carnitine CoA-transferase CaiB-like acyl-CoA transferase